MRLPFSVRAVPLLFALAGAGPSSAADPTGQAGKHPHLSIREKGTENAWIAYGDAPALGYGPSPQNLLTCLPPGDALDPDLDFRDFASWAFSHGITIVRSYPPSSIVGPRYLDLFERAASDTSRFDLTRYNDAWFARLREACTLLRAHGVFVHLQLWQAVTWKKNWDGCYYNPDRNVNAELARNAGPAAFVIDPKRDPNLIAHQKEHVRRILESTGDLGNVVFDLMNEIGNGTGVSAQWTEAMLDEVEAWEKKTGLDALIGLNDEGRDRAETGKALSNPRFDVAFLDLGRYDEHVETRARVKKPTLGIRNIDWNPETKTRAYFAGELDIAINPDPALASRTRRMFWRLFMAKAQMSAAYADLGRLAYRGPSLVGFDLWPFQNIRRIVTHSPWIESFGELKIANNLVNGSPTEFMYALDSPRLALVFFESAPGTAGTVHPATEIRIAPHPEMGKPEARVLYPATAVWRSSRAARQEAEIIVRLPEFTDELLLVVFDSADDPEVERVPTGVKVSAEVRDGAVHLSWPENRGGLLARVHRLEKESADRGELSRTPSLVGGTEGKSFIDEAPGPGTWLYTVAWKDDSTRTTYEADGLFVTVPDRAPSVPEIRALKIDTQRVALWAAGNLDPDIDHVEWERRAAGEDAWNSLASTPQVILEDKGLTRGAMLEYRARAHDAAGQASEWSETFSVTPEVPVVTTAPGIGIAKVRTLARRPFAIVLVVFAGLVLGVLVGRRAKRRQ